MKLVRRVIMNGARVLKGNMSPDEAVIKEGFRFVKPYIRDYRVNCKGRWIGMPLADAYCEEFSVPKDVCENMINEGLIKINGHKKTPEYVMKHADLLEYDDIRTDKPIIDFTQIEVIHEDEYFFVIQKPCSVPVHPKGRYLKNSLTMILEHDYGLKDLKLLHRLDKVTSGVLIFGKNAAVARVFTRILKTNQVKKFYLARVTGHFKGGTQDEEIYFDDQNFCHVTKSLQRINDRRGIWRSIDKNEPIKDEKQENVNTTIQNIIKTAHTMFRLLGYDEKTNTSLLFCAPITGRTHQIREHLRVLDHQIINDDEHMIEDLEDDQKGAQGWRTKMDIIKKFNGDNEKCFEYFMEQTMSDFFKAKYNPGEYRIDLHALHYCVKLSKEDVLEMKELKQKKRQMSHGKMQKMEERAKKRLKRMHDKGLITEEDKKPEVTESEITEDDTHLKALETKEDIPDELMLDFETKILPEWCRVFEQEPKFHEILKQCVDEAKRYAYKHQYYD